MNENDREQLNRRSVYYNKVTKHVFQSIWDELCSEMPIYHLIEPKGWIDIKYLWLMKDPSKRQFCQDIYKHLPDQFTSMVSQTNKYLPIFLGLAFLHMDQDYTMVV